MPNQSVSQKFNNKINKVVNFLKKKEADFYL